MDGASAVEARPGGYLGYAPIDCDIHCAVPDTTALLPYFDEYWRNAIIERGIDRLSLNLTSYPPDADLGALRLAPKRQKAGQRFRFTEGAGARCIRIALRDPQLPARRAGLPR